MVQLQCRTPPRAGWPWWARARRVWRRRGSCSATATPCASSRSRPARAARGPTTRARTRCWAATRAPSTAACTRRCAPTCRASSWASRASRWQGGPSRATRARSRATGRSSPSSTPSPRTPASRSTSGSAPRCSAWRPSSVRERASGGRWSGAGRTARWRRRCSTPSSSAPGTAPCLWCPRSEESTGGKESKCTATTTAFRSRFEIRASLSLDWEPAELTSLEKSHAWPRRCTSHPGTVRIGWARSSCTRIHGCTQRSIASKMTDWCALLKVQRWQQILFFTAQGIATISPSSTWTDSLSMTTALGHFTSTSSRQNTRPISPSSGYRPRALSSSRSSWRPSGWPPSCPGASRCPARRTCWPPCSRTTGAWRRPGRRSATRTFCGPNGWNTSTGSRSRWRSRIWKQGGTRCTRRRSSVSGHWMRATEIDGTNKKNSARPRINAMEKLINASRLSDSPPS